MFFPKMREMMFVHITSCDYTSNHEITIYDDNMTHPHGTEQTTKFDQHLSKANELMKKVEFSCEGS